MLHHYLVVNPKSKLNIALNNIRTDDFHSIRIILRPIFSSRLLQLLSYVCNKTQASIQLRDACYGCFFRAVSLSGGSSELIALSQCSNIYLSNSTFALCAQNLAVSNLNGLVGADLKHI